MITAWTKHIKDSEEKLRFESSVLHARFVLERLDELLTEMYKEGEDLELNTKVYDIPNWSYRQADLNGYKRAIRLVKRLINLDQKDNNDNRQLNARGRSDSST